MTTVIWHFFIGLFGSLGIFLALNRFAGVNRFSFPSAVFIIGLSCASMAYYLSPWSTPVILILYTIASIGEIKQQ